MSLATVTAMRPASTDPVALRAAIATARTARRAALDRCDAIERQMASAMLTAGDDEIAELERNVSAEQLQADRLAALIEELSTALQQTKVAPAMTMPVIPTELAAALSEAEAAMAERARLVQLQSRFASERAAAVAGKPAAVAAVDAAEIELALATAATMAAATVKAEAARAALAESTATIDRCDRAGRGLVARLAAADTAIADAATAMVPAVAPYHTAVAAAFEAELQAAAGALADVLMRGHALRAAGFSTGMLLDDVALPSAIGTGQIIGANRYWPAPGQMVDLADFGADPDAAALFASLRPIRDVTRALVPEVARIDRGAETARMADADARRRAADARYGGQYSTLPERPVAAPVEPAARFEPNAYQTRQPGTPAPVETNVVAGGWDAAMQQAAG